MHRFTSEGSLPRAALTPRLGQLRSCHLAAGLSLTPGVSIMQRAWHCQCTSQPRPAAWHATKHSGARLALRPAQPREPVARPFVRLAGSHQAGQQAACHAAYTADMRTAHSGSQAGAAPVWDERGSEASGTVSSQTLPSTFAATAAANGADVMVAGSVDQTPASGSPISAGVAAQLDMSPGQETDRNARSAAAFSAGADAGSSQPVSAESAVYSAGDSSAAGDAVVHLALAPSSMSDDEAALISSADGEVGSVSCVRSSMLRGFTSCPALL